MQNKPKLGQHWLKDESALTAMVEAAEVKPSDNVLEIGPGQGALTDKLAAAGANVTAVELDAELAEKLNKTFKDSQRIQVVQGDIREFDLSALKPGYKVAANIPYYLTAPLLNKLVTSSNPPSMMALLVQKEVAERLAAEPGNLSILGVAVQFYGEVEAGRTVPAEAFLPPPRVDSAVVIIKHKTGANSAKIEQIMKIVRHGFANRRKTLANSLSAGLGLDKPKVEKLLERAGLAKNARAQELSLKQWEKLSDMLESEV